MRAIHGNGFRRSSSARPIDLARSAFGASRTSSPGDFFYVPAGHDSWVVGDEAQVSLHILGSEDDAAPAE